MPQKIKITVDPLPEYPDIILALHFINSEPIQYHWLIFIQDKQSDSGTKIHVQGLPGQLTFEATNHSLMSSATVTSAAVIGSLGSSSVADLVELLSQIPVGVVPPTDSSRESKFTCRVWVREAIRRMHDQGIIICPDVDALETEMKEYGEAAVQLIEENVFTTATLYTAKSSYSI